MRPAFHALLLLGLIIAPGVQAEEKIGASDQAAIQTIINRQLDAFKAGDATTAESFASPGIRERFPDSSSFLGMVKQAYGPLVAPKSTRFGELAQTPLGLVQKMTVVDNNGAVWTAAYTMTLVDGQWRISGCYMLKSEAVDA